MFRKDPLFLHVWDDDRRFGYGRRNRTNQLHLNIYHGYSHDHFYLRSDSNMLIEDIHVGVLPYLHHRPFEKPVPPLFSFVDPVANATAKIVIDGLVDRHHAFDLTEACSDFIRETAQHLMIYGDVYYELVYEMQDGQLQSFSLESIPSGYLVKILGNYYQVIPWWVARKARTRAGIIKIPEDKVLHIRFPRSLGGRRKLMRILSRMYKISNEVLPSFTMESMRQNEETGFDSNEYSKNKYLEIAKLTKMFGWNQRTRKNNHITEFYFFERYLDSQLANVYLREAILGDLNRFLNGPIINLGTSIQMEGYATQAEIAGWRSRLSAGGLKFLDMFNDLKER